MSPRVRLAGLLLAAAATGVAFGHVLDADQTPTDDQQAKWVYCVTVVADGSDASLHECDRLYGEFDLREVAK